MNYVRVLVGEATFHGREPLTYSHSTSLKPGQLVTVPLRSKQVLGVAVADAAKPLFNVKPISGVVDAHLLPSQLLHLLDWMREYYPAPLGVITQLFLPKALPKKPLPAQQPSAATQISTLPALTPEQKEAVSAINTPGLHLLHGETGSGKTRVYIELAARALKASKS